MPSPTPARFPAGVSTDPVWGPLAQFGLPNRFSYHYFADDFDDSLAVASVWAKNGTGTVVNTAGDGGLALFATTAVAAEFEQMQLSVGGFTFTAGKKSFFLTRLQVSDVINAGVIAGLIQTTATAFTVTDGLYFFKASGSATNLVLRHTVGSVNTDIVIPTAAYTLANNTNIDLGWFVDRNQNIYAFVGSQLVGYMNQSGTGPVSSSGTSILPVLGPVAALQQAVTPLTLTAVALNPTLAILAGTTTIKNMTVDLVMAAKER